MKLHWPQIVWLILTGIELGIAMAKHGEPRPKHNFWTGLIAVAISLTLLYFGGFWT